MRRQLYQLAGFLLWRSSVLSRSVSPMDFWVIEHRIWEFGTRRGFAQRFLIRLQQRKHNRDNLPCNPTHHFTPANILARFLVKTALDGNQALIDLAPFALLQPNGLPDHEV